MFGVFCWDLQCDALENENQFFFYWDLLENEDRIQFRIRRDIGSGQYREVKGLMTENDLHGFEPMDAGTDFADALLSDLQRG